MAETEDPQEISTDDRRQYDRSRLIVDVHFDGAESTGVASTKDISVGGLYLRTQTRIPVGAMLALRLPIGGDHVIATGEVVYSNPGEGVGVKFHELADDTRRALERGLRPG
ncbi:MAG: PilZ domain-containing protein [Acidobacteriota bacterium]